MVINNQGNVGIGTTSPPQLLTVGSSSVGGNELISKGWLCVTTGDQCSGIGSPAAGTVYAVGTYTTGADVAENYPTNDPTLTAGDVVAADTGLPVYVTKATSTSPILGIVSTKPGVLLNGYNSQSFANASTVPVALSGRVPVNVSNENGSIAIGDYLAPSQQFPGYVMKATQAGFVLGRALENFTASSTSPTPNLGSVLIFIQPTQYMPKVADLLQNGANSDQQTWLQSLANLNMTDASVFGDIAVEGSLAVQKDLHVGGVIYAATLNVDNLTVNKTLCIGQTCVTESQLKALLQLVQNQNSSPSSGGGSSGGSSGDSGQVAGVSTSTPSSGGGNSTTTPSATPTSSPSPTPTLTTIPTPTPMPTVTPTPTPIVTPSPSPTVVPTPTPTPAPADPSTDASTGP